MQVPLAATRARKQTGRYSILMVGLVCLPPDSEGQVSRRGVQHCVLHLHRDVSRVMCPR